MAFGDATVMPERFNTERAAFVIKWFSSVLSIIGYGMTGFGMEPWNVYFFLVGVSGWFIVGLLWNDRAIILIHIIAFAAMVLGLLSQN